MRATRPTSLTPHLATWVARTVILCLLVGLAPAHAAEPLPLRYGVLESVSYPLVTRDSKGAITGGMLRDLAEAMALELKTTMQPLSFPRKRMEGAVRAGEVDLVCYTSPQWSELPDQLLWTIPSVAQVERIVTKPGKMLAQPVEVHVENKKIAPQLGYRYPSLQGLFASGKVKRLDQTRGDYLFKAVDSGEADALITSESEIEGFYFAQPHHRGRFEASPYAFSKDGLNNHPPNEVAVGQFSNSGISQVIFRNRMVFYAQMGRLRAL